MMEKIKKSLLLVILGICFCTMCGFDDDEKKVYDTAGLLSEEQELELELECNRLGEKYKTEIIILTTDDAGYMTSEQYAESFVIQNDIGYKENRTDKSCILYLIDMDNREVYMYLGGVTQYYLDSKWDGITDTSVTYLKAGDYYEACTRFLSDTDYYIDKKYDKFEKKYRSKWDDFYGNYDDFEKEYIQEPFWAFLKNPLWCLLIAAVISAISVSIMTYSNKSKMTANGNTYMDKNAFRFHRKSDHFIRTTTKKHKISSSGSSGGHSGSRSGGGGRSHGGGGKKF